MKDPKWALQPSKKTHNNQTFKGDHLTDGYGQQVRNLHLTMTTHSLIMVWKCQSLWEKIKFLFHGEITVEIQGHRLPPLSVVMGDPVERFPQAYGENIPLEQA